MNSTVCPEVRDHPEAASAAELRSLRYWLGHVLAIRHCIGTSYSRAAFCIVLANCHLVRYFCSYKVINLPLLPQRLLPTLR